MELIREIDLPACEQMFIRCSESFMVVDMIKSEEAATPVLLGPPSGDRRVFKVEASLFDRTLQVWSSTAAAVTIDRFPLKPSIEFPDPRPMEAPLKQIKNNNLTDQIRAFIREEVSRQAEVRGHGSFEEEDDFEEVEEAVFSAYQLNQMQEEAPPPADNAPPPAGGEPTGGAPAPAAPPPELRGYVGA